MDKNLVFYYSGTGNSFSVAKELASKLGDTLLIPVLSVKDDIIIGSEVETVVLVYPIYINAIPRLMREFISRLKVQNSSYVYAIATHGGKPGMSGGHLHKVLKNMNINLKGYFEIEMINNSPKGVAPKPFMILNWELSITEEKVTPILKEAIQQIQSIACSINARDTSSLEALQSKEHGVAFRVMKGMWKINEISKTKLHFLLEDGCVGCGICEKVCLTNRISLVEGKPQWKDEQCYYCYACFNYCPNQAIGVKYYTKKLGRYHHPDFEWTDIAAQKIAK